MVSSTDFALKPANGNPLPYGAVVTEKGVNFSLFSRHATSIILSLFKDQNDSEPYFTYTFDPLKDRTGDIWHVFIEGLKPGALYLYRANGPFAPEKGHRFNKNIYLLDPYAKALTATSLFKNLPPDYVTPTDNLDIKLGRPYDAKWFPKCVVVDDSFDWQGDRPLNYPLRKSVLYETHLKGITANPNSEVAHPGTYKGLTEKIPYFKDLGITSIELLPIQEFDEYENTNTNPKTGERLKNFWGYSTMAFFAPKASYAADSAPGVCVTEFKEMVREMHRAGIEIILDIVFNHTAEGNEHGITMNFRGLDNSIYYILENENKAFYSNYSGCGNTLNCNHPVVRDFIIDCLRYWVCEMHVDGFRFDLGSILGRDSTGQLMEDPPVLERIAEDPILRNTKIIAEAWDAGGAYQVGSFPGGRWAEWNDRFRDDVRKFWRGDDGLSNALATRLAGSSDLYLRDGRKPFHSVNFLTSHDGFTLNDLVSYNGKHNEENGENNRDGSDNNNSYNYGYEGPSMNPAIETLRTRQAKNLIFTLLLAQGTPMLLAGDEFRRTQGGNNNAYCQDNISSWVDWSLRNKYSELFRFTKKLILFRRKHHAFMRPEFFQGKDISFNSLPDITWFDESGLTPDWGRLNHFLAYRLDGSHAEIFADTDDNDFFIMFNSALQDKTVKIPLPPIGKKWYRCIDTSIEAPEDFMSPGEEEILPVQNRYVLPARSCALLMSKL
ncbi:MAG: glycogen debranching protein GlgX [Spirochaetaceae bacterium]|nr:glycogen debranching protein GlgX [Spirochaetaceae bacterium]